MLKQFADSGLSGASPEMDYPDVGGNPFDAGPRAIVLPGEYIDGDAGLAQRPGKFADVYVHAPRLSLPGSGQGAGVERNKGCSLEAQTRFTTIL